ncbi:MAG: hypothetical protein QG562_360 [Patescibacteria group bacterium]|nr:hypothetical protein [Patescibacteria group bacterium]
MNEILQKEIPNYNMPATTIDYLEYKPSTFVTQNIGGLAITFPEKTPQPAFETSMQINEEARVIEGSEALTTITDHAEMAETVKEGKILCEISTNDLDFIASFDVDNGDRSEFSRRGIAEPKDGCYYAYMNDKGEIEFVIASEDDLGTKLDYFKNPDLVGELNFEYSTKVGELKKSKSVDSKSQQEPVEKLNIQDSAENITNELLEQVKTSIEDLKKRIEQSPNGFDQATIEDLIFNFESIVKDLKSIQQKISDILSFGKDDKSKVVNISSVLDGIIDQAQYIKSILEQSSGYPNNPESLDERSMRNLYNESLISIRNGLDYI